MRLGIIALIMFPLLCFGHDGGRDIKVAELGNLTLFLIINGLLLVFVMIVGEMRKEKKSHSVQKTISYDSPQSSGWSTLYQVCGSIFLFAGFIGTIAVAQKNGEAAFQLAVMAIGLSLTCFLFAFLIDVLTDMREYLRRMAEKQ
ncbi:MAG: hypothetical protein QF600_00985 [Verrucomicrobiota bacterium]|nr:hypothetical protein [Verrucomicrobiota bacterium]